MNIVAPVSSVSEVEMLLHHGANELYCGVRTPEWERYFGGQWWMNRRSPHQANLDSWEDLKEVVRLAHEKDVLVHFTLNASFYPEGSFPYLLRLSEKLAKEIEIDSLIVSDLSLIRALCAERLPLRLHLSSLGACFNAKTAAYYQSLGIKRIILPRQLNLPEIKNLISKTDSKLEFEVFAVNDGCCFEEGLCQTTHTLGPFCLTQWATKVSDLSKKKLSKGELERYLKSFREYLWYQNNCGSSYSENGLPNGPCSLCWFGYFRDWGVKAVKIVGREASFLRKLGSIQLVKAVVDEVRDGASTKQIASVARSLRDTPEHCDKGYMCYFSEN